MSGLDTHLKPEPWYRRRWVHVTAIAVAIVALVIVFGGRAQKVVPEPAEYAERMFVAVNEARLEQGVDELVWSTCVTDAALVAADGYRYQLNVSRDVESIDCAGLTFAGELVTRSSNRPEEVIERWLGLQRWSELLLDPSTTHVGIGCFPGGTPENPQATCSVLTAARG